MNLLASAETKGKKQPNIFVWLPLNMGITVKHFLSLHKEKYIYIHDGKPPQYLQV